ncbi:MAG TPA: alpha-glucan family phosphorylase [Spirochaetota bacterium]|nr:alpha-glucan family phosphorylase [Spirochaetota bacterium]HPI90013.1 alpha-glucan family phosphorylase [Spirochaetota bacterium]HPR47263.1 alpha-glucan family phosphorylase [Spirochaetota bacterium]
MTKIKRFKVVPYLPDKLKPLMKIVKNMWWVWNFEAIELFRRLDVELWRETHQNPLKLLGAISQKSLDEASESESFIAHMQRVEEELDWHLTRKTWYDENMKEVADAGIAYFSAEFGIHECLPIYSGGLGVLAGDHLKSSSELGLPFTGIGLLYRLGYFQQYLNLDGWQNERFPETDFHNIPASLVLDDKGEPVQVSVEFPGKDVFMQIWEVKVGKISLYLLDTNIDRNSDEDKSITDQLYGGDNEMRIKQEMILGIGGLRALRTLKKNITVFHMNEGHAAFLALERIREMMHNEGLSFKEAMNFVTASNVFTTHTPVPAGNDRFGQELIQKYFHNYHIKLGLSEDEFLALGRENPADRKEPFCMTVLAIKTSAGCNGVSKLHGQVSKNMWKNIWTSLPVHEVPIGNITNGVQTLSWTSDEMMRLFNRYLGPRWIDNPGDNTIWKNIDAIPDSELWRCRERLRERLVAFARRKLKEQLLARGASPKEAEQANSVLHPDTLTIGFARRFATYKRANLILRDIEKLKELLHDRERPMQIIFAGKAHPRDNMGKELIKQIIHITNDDRFRNKIVFIEDYNINIARYLVQGVDVWLNTPIRPKEASGTSGMKVIPNGGLNISVLDGWWDEAYNSKNGWAIGKGEEYTDLAYQDDVESFSLYNILEKEVKAIFYNRGVDGLPREWLGLIRESMKSLNPEFNTNRMVKDYTEKYYKKAHKNYMAFKENSYEKIKVHTKWKERVCDKWGNVLVKNIIFDEKQEITVGSRVIVRTEVVLGDFKPDDVSVELYFGSLNQYQQIVEGVAMPMRYISKDKDGIYIYEGQMLCLRAGQFGFTVRVLPRSELLPRKFDPDLMITWAT